VQDLETASVHLIRASLRLPYQPPLDWERFLRFFAIRDSVESVSGGAYARSALVGGVPAVVSIEQASGEPALDVTVGSFEPVDLGVVTQRLRRSFDLETDPASVVRRLGTDPFMASLAERHAAVRVPSHWDPFETAIRAVMGQQITLLNAARLNSRLVDRAGPRVDFGAGMPTRLFPDARQVLAADLSDMGMPGARVRTLQAVAAASLESPTLFSRSASAEETVARLTQIKGIGPWTAHYIALRACGEPDAFPASDAGLLRGAAGADGRKPTPRELEARAEAWRPYRAYAAHYIWASDEARSFDRNTPATPDASGV
jgi:AraC family transcriptional regulator of adaptative response / DNA-3-methyladenine glycosylase II